MPSHSKTDISEDGGYTLSIDQVANRFDISPREVRRMIRSGALDARRIGEQWKIRFGRNRAKALHGDATTITLWHGTSQKNAQSIQKNGFKTKTKGKQIWFTSKENRARRHAIGRAEGRNDIPVLITCEIDLSIYPNFWQQSDAIYVFHRPIDQNVIKHIEVVDTQGLPDQSKKQSSVDVMVTQTSGKPGVSYWIIQYLELQKKEPVGMDHPVIEATTSWVNNQYANGRQDPISEDEMIAIVSEYL